MTLEPFSMRFFEAGEMICERATRIVAQWPATNDHCVGADYFVVREVGLSD
ncbi:hypothetical protein ACVWW3_008191 [Bradyrhizobium sp. LM2.9]